jgi:Amt family ammonium transporter
MMTGVEKVVIMVLDSGNTAWVLASTALVMIMIPGLGFFYSGLVRKKNVVDMMALSIAALALVGIQWVVIGYSLAFGPDVNGVIGSLNLMGLESLLNGVSPTGIPWLAFISFQLMFAAITLAIVTSGMAERVKWSAFLVFGLLWTTLVYDPLAHWVWGGGWLAQLGAIDFAGGTVVHISSGFSALAVALVIGKRKGFGDHSFLPHNIPMTILGAALLWFGWFGFNAGSALAANGSAANAFLVTNTATCAGALSWMAASWYSGKPSALALASGAVAGLVAITPAAGYVDPLSAIVIGAVAGIVCYKVMGFRIKKGLDESLDAWAVHGTGGIWGALATGIFATLVVSGSGHSGLLYGNIAQFGDQLVAIAVAVGWSFGVTFVLAKLVNRFIGFRVTEEEEYVGLDVSQHGEKGYT